MRIDSLRLSRGERAFLGEKGISAKEWDSMPDHVQNAWRAEMKNPQHETARQNKGKGFQINGSLVSKNHWLKQL